MTRTSPALTLRPAVMDDLPVLTVLNQQLIEDQHHGDPATLAELGRRMRQWLSGDYRVDIAESGGAPVAYAVWREDEDGILLRQFYVARGRRRTGIGRATMELLERGWQGRAVRVSVLLPNERAQAFFREIGFRDYSVVLRRD
ncbi:MAG TPA: GNAT family N-acetyltransferase [Pseudonocardiaceae bacterium]|nr:GNAT family N-acetyltransferase [Pseudonocardiaceae bacterium]